MSDGTHHERLARTVQELARLAVPDRSLLDTLRKVADVANSALDGSDMVGLTLLVNGAPATPVSTAEEAPDIDAVQYATGQGPCVQSFRDGAVHLVASTASESRWPAFVRTCERHGILSTLSVPIRSSTERLGAMNFYSRSVDAFPPDDVGFAEVVAAQAAALIVNARAYWSALEVNAQLSEALESRVIIEQAKGILMAAGHTSDEAFEALRRASQRSKRKLREVAAEVVAETERRATDPARPREPGSAAP
jgi:GAF domain-containing protein